MSSRSKLHCINDEIISCYKKTYGNDDEAIYLYGSYARNEETNESDIDYVALINRNQEDIKKLIYDLWDCTSDIDLNYNVVISAMAIRSEDFKKYNRSYPYYSNILKDGIKIYDRYCYS